MKKGDSRRGPFSCTRIDAFLDAGQPADARADQHAGAVAFFLGLRLPSRNRVTACLAAARPKMMKSSMRRCSLGSTH